MGRSTNFVGRHPVATSVGCRSRSIAGPRWSRRFARSPRRSTVRRSNSPPFRRVIFDSNSPDPTGAANAVGRSTNQVASRATSSARVGACDDEDIVAALGIQWAHGVNVRVAMDFQGALAEQRACTAATGLELHRGRQRWLEVAKCPHAHCARVAYRVTERGVEEIV